MKKSLFLEKANIEKTAKKYVLENANGMRMEFTDFGAIVLSLMIKDKDGIVRDVVLGFQQMKDYLRNDMGMGAYIGRNANRIKDAKVTIEGVEYTLKKILGNHNIHSGPNRSHYEFYDAKTGQDENGQYVEFSRLSPHLEQGLPGNLQQNIRYTLTDQNEFIIDYHMVSDKTTIVNPTNHCYFNLDGHDSGTIFDHELEVYSDKYLEIDEEMIPTGEYVDVKDTPMDFRKRKRIGQDIDSDYLHLQYAHGYDHTYVFDVDRSLKKVAKLYGAHSGITMTVFSDLCGLQVYSGNYFNGNPGKQGAVYQRNGGMCLETQFFPNACNEKRFPSPLLRANERFASRTVYHFEIE